MKRGADLAVRELAVSEVTIAIVEHTYCAFRNGDVNSKAQCQLLYCLNSQRLLLWAVWLVLVELVLQKWCRGGSEREGKTSWRRPGYWQRDSGLRYVKNNQVEDVEIATLPKSTTKTSIAILHWHWVAAFTLHLPVRAATLVVRGLSSLAYCSNAKP
jgi:hypothetical protein